VRTALELTELMVDETIMIARQAKQHKQTNGIDIVGVFVVSTCRPEMAEGQTEHTQKPHDSRTFCIQLARFATLVEGNGVRTIQVS
jgi:hypothetical protein